MKKLAIITKTVTIKDNFTGETGSQNYREKETIVRFLGVLIYKETIIFN